MKRLIAIVLSVLFVAGASYAAPPADPQAEKEVMTAMQEWAKALMTRDRAALERLYHSDLSYGHSSGMVETKAQAVDHIVNSKADYAAVDIIEPKLKIQGNVALLNSRVNFKQVTDGKATDVKLFVLHVWVKGPQGWQMIGRQSTREGSQ
jgi:ketosteroid isomerase-like protein